MKFEEQLIKIISYVFIVTGDGPKHADEEIWSSGSTPLSLHLFFNLSGIQSQTRSGFQLYVTGAKLRLLKFAEVCQTTIGKANNCTNVEMFFKRLRSGSLLTHLTC